MKTNEINKKLKQELDSYKEFVRFIGDTEFCEYCDNGTKISTGYDCQRYNENKSCFFKLKKDWKPS